MTFPRGQVRVSLRPTLSGAGLWRLALRVLVSGGVLTLLFTLLPWHQIRQALAQLGFGVWLVVLTGFLAGHRLGVLKWQLMVNLGRSVLGGVDAVRCYAAGLFANLTLPSIIGGDVLRAALAGRTTGRWESAVLGGVGDRLSDVTALILLLVGGSLAARGSVSGHGARLALLSLVGGALVGSMVLMLLVRRSLRSWPPRLRRRVGRSLVVLRRLRRKPGIGIKALGLSLVIQTGFILLNAWIGHSVGIDVSLATWFVVWPVAKVVGLIPISLGGLGVRDATLGVLLVPLGVPLARGVVASLVWQSILIAGGLIAGGVWWVLSRLNRADCSNSIKVDRSGGAGRCLRGQ